MGRLKKPPKNAYYFFVISEKDKYEPHAHHLPGGFQVYSRKYGQKWPTMTKEEKEPYEKMAKHAKQQEKFNDNNKFTVTGETYAQIHQKAAQQQYDQQHMEKFISELVSGPDAGDRHIIFMKALFSVEEIVDRRTRQYWPSEISMTAFSVKGGIKSIYTQLVDTKQSPTGYASQAKDHHEETLLPMPGNQSLMNDDCRDYSRIFKNIVGFSNHWLQDGYEAAGHKRVFFALDNEREPIVSCLQWLVNQMRGSEREKYQYFLDRLKVYKISKLILSMADEANRVNPNYQNYLVQFKLESAADQVVTKGNYDYREEIACGYHRLDFASMKMHTCAQSIVMRRAYMLFEEFVPGFGYEWVDKHKIDKLGKGIRGPVIKKKREKSPVKEEMKVQEPDWLNEDDDPEIETVDYSYMASASCDIPAWGESPAPAPPTFEEDDFPTLGATGGYGGGSSGRNGNSMWERRSSSSSAASASRSPSRSTYNFESSNGGGRGSRPKAPASYTSTATTTSTGTSFMDDDDFPTLGSSSMGRGRGGYRY